MIRLKAVFTSLLALMAGCGGSQTPGSDRVLACETEGSDIAEQPAVCDEDEVGRFETTVKAWDDRCGAVVHPETADRVAAKLAESVGCTEEVRALKVKKQQCRDKIADLEARKACPPGKCERLLKEIQSAVSKCSLLGETETDIPRARALIGQTEARLAEHKRVSDLETLGAECTEANALLENDDAEGAIERIIQAIEAASLEEVSASKNPDIEKAKAESFAVCRPSLKSAISRHVETMETELRSRRIRRDPETWMARFRNLEGMSRRLQAVGAEAIYPEATDAIDALLLGLDKLKNKIAAKKDGGQVAGDEAASNDVVGSASRKCKKMMSEVKRVKDKIAQHEKEGNAKKVAAYTKKLKASEESLESLKKELSEELGSETMSDERRAAIERDLEAAGCPL